MQKEMLGREKQVERRVNQGKEGSRRGKMQAN